MQVNLNKPICNSNGQPIEGFDRTIGQEVSKVICQSVETKFPIKFWGWAIKLEANEPLELDKEDYNLLKEWITSNQMMTVLLKGQILLLLDELKE